MLRRDQLIGALVVRRRSPGEFAEDVGTLLQSLANQSALAIVNARVYGELSTSRRDLEVAGRHKSEFLASMSHELRTPLNAVIGFSDVLLGGMFGTLNERQEEYLGDIHSSGRHLLELLNEILDLSKIEAGQMRLEPAVFSVPAALDYAVSVVRERAVKHGIELTVEVADDVRLVESDELRFKQVVVNLLGNAVKFTPAGGAIALRARRESGELVVSVSDTGIGIAPEDQELIFESFQQGRRGTVKEEGTGLGLTLCRRIVELFGGRLTLDSEVGSGSVFEFRIPVTPYRPVEDGVAAAGAGRGDPHRGRRPRLARADGCPPGGDGRAAAPGARRRDGPRAGEDGGSCRHRPGHPAARAGRVAGAARNCGRTRPRRAYRWSWRPSSTTALVVWSSARLRTWSSRWHARSWSLRSGGWVRWRPRRSRGVRPRRSGDGFGDGARGRGQPVEHEARARRARVCGLHGAGGRHG